MEEGKSKHARIKKDIEEYFNFFEDNIKRHKQSTRFAFKETVSEEERQVLEITQKPPIEINYTQAYLSRLLGEFSKQTPEIAVSGNGTGDNINVMTVELVEGIIRERLQRGACALWVTHDRAQAERVASRWLEIEAGRLREVPS